MTTTTSGFKSEIGWVAVQGDATTITRVDFVDEKPKFDNEPSPLVAKAVGELEEYFAGKRQYFTVPVRPEGSDFQNRVWVELKTIPYGHTRSYQDVGRSVGDGGAARAVGQAVGQNPVAIIIPCHRVLGKSGHITGYGGGIWRKKFLLKLEGAQHK